MIAKLEQTMTLDQAVVQSVELPILHHNNVSLDVLRIDRIHPIISGNKWFKLKYSLQQAMEQDAKSIVTIGGAYSNHILATACACKEAGIKSIGVVRGERPKHLSCTLAASMDYGMEIHFLSRSVFANQSALQQLISSKYGSSFMIEEGGRNDNGIRGSEEMLSLAEPAKYQYICCSLGTGTMMAGILRSSVAGQRILGFSSLKIVSPQNELAIFLEEKIHGRKEYRIMYDYHFGGYAKYDQKLLQFMNELFTSTSIPTDFVYTGKLFFGIIDLVKKSYFQPGKAILAIHSGGLQGNCSLPAGTLLF